MPGMMSDHGPDKRPVQVPDESELMQAAVGLAHAYAETLPPQTALDPTGQSDQAKAAMTAVWHAALTYFQWLSIDWLNAKDFPSVAMPTPPTPPPPPTPAPVPTPAGS